MTLLEKEQAKARKANRLINEKPQGRASLYSCPWAIRSERYQNRHVTGAVLGIHSNPKDLDIPGPY